MYIDSGADVTLIPLSFGRLLGLELKKEDIKHLRGVGGGEVPVIVTNAEIRMNNLLGRSDLFDRFKVVFDQTERVIIFENKSGSNE